MKNNLKWILSVVIVLTFSFGLYFFNNTKPSNKVIKNTTNQVSPFEELRYSPRTKKVAEYYLQLPKGKTKQDQADQVYFKKLLNDPIMDHFFHYTISFFNNKPEAYPAARFVALSMKFDSQTPEHIHMMEWTRAEVQKNSQALFSTIKDKQNEIYKNTYFHNRILNLVHQLNVAPEKKLEIYSETISKPIEFKNQDELSENSNVLEVALILARQSIHDPSVMAPVIARALESNQNDEQKSALKARVLNQYPMLDYLF